MKKLLDKFHKLGICISYDRVMQIENKTANSVCEQYRLEDLVCPPVLKKGLFTVTAADNIDQNSSSLSARSSYHSTAVSVMQFPTAWATASGC